MKAATLFSGIGSPEVARPDWHWLWCAEIDRFASAVLAARHSSTVNLGNVLTPDFLDRAKSFGPLDVLVGGPPCQAFSVAGLRNSLADPRGNLSLRWVQIIHAISPVWSVTENVPGWLNTPDNAFGCFLGALVGADEALRPPGNGGWPRIGMVAGPLARACWRVLDAQYFGLAQRRERVFVVASARDGCDPCQVLFEPEGLRGHPPPRRQAGQGTTGSLGASLDRGGTGQDAAIGNLIAFQCQGTNVCEPGTLRAGNGHVTGGLPCVAYGGNDTRGPIAVSTALNALNAHGGSHGRLDFESETPIAHAFDPRQSDVLQYGDMTGPLDTDGHTTAVMAFDTTQITSPANRSQPRAGDPCHTLAARANAPAIAAATVRRLTPTEAERLQGFPDVRKSAIIRVCRNEDETRELARSAGTRSALPKPGQSGHAVVSVQIDLERQHLQLHSPERSSWSASAAEHVSSSPLSMPADAFVRLVVHTIAIGEAATHAGRAAPPQSTSGSSAPRSGSMFAALCGREIDELASDAERFTMEVNRCMKFIISEAGPNSPSLEVMWRTSSCCVTAAISGFIPETIRPTSSFDLNIETVNGYTAIEYRGKPAADGPRYRALGNSMAVPVMRWLLTRIEAVDGTLAPANLGEAA